MYIFFIKIFDDVIDTAVATGAIGSGGAAASITITI